MAVFLAAMIIKLIYNDFSWIQEAVILASLFTWAIVISITVYSHIYHRDIFKNAKKLSIGMLLRFGEEEHKVI